MEGEFGRSGVGLKKNFEEDLWVLGDKDLLYRAFYNVLANAQQALDMGGTIDIHVFRRDDRAVLDFTDSGKGFDPETLPHLLEPFFTTKEGGTGLGLPIVKSIIESHGGTIELSNAEEGGARVEVTLPLAVEYMNSKAESEAREALPGEAGSKPAPEKERTMSEKNAHILIIDDEKNYLLVLQTLLEDEGYTVTALSDPETALAFLQESEVDVVVTDMKMPRITGLDVLERVKKQCPYIPVLIMTAFGTIESAVETMKYGAFDYITKPFSNDELLLSIHNAVELAQAHREYKLLQEAMQERFGLHTIIGRSAGISQVKLMVERAAPGRTTVLITGESGTGKELVARAVHLGSPRKDKPFVVVECAALTGDALEKELFGQETASSAGTPAIRRGRVEQADGGTLFLDDMAALTPDLQDRRFERVGGSTPIEVDVRFVMATNTDLAKKVEEGTFREDLYYRVNVVQIHLPPLRERREDIPLLVAHFVAKFTADNNMKQQKSFSTQALNYLTGYDWPGNIRQLENVVESCMVLVPGNVIEEENLPAEIRDEESQFKSAVDLLPVQLDLADTLQKIEAALIRRALVRADLVQVKAAELLNISKSLLQYKLKKYGITGH